MPTGSGVPPEPRLLSGLLFLSSSTNIIQLLEITSCVRQVLWRNTSNGMNTYHKGKLLDWLMGYSVGRQANRGHLHTKETENPIADSQQIRKTG